MKTKKTITLLTFLFTICTFSQEHTALLKKMEAYDNNKMYNNIEREILNTTKYILFQPFNVTDKDKLDALEAVNRWSLYTDNHTFPIMGTLHEAIKDDVYLVSLYKTAMVNYILDQKLNYNRMITCHINPPKGKTYLMQNDVQELHYESAIIFINYLKENNELKHGKGFSKIVASNKQNNLRKELFNNLP